MSSKQVNALTIDVEDYYQVSAFEHVLSRSSWPSLESRVERNTDRLLALFSEHNNTKATFFVLGSVAERFPNIVKSIVAEGHELASHGTAHLRASDQTAEEFRQDVGDAKRLLEDLGGVAVNGYRAPSFSFTKQNEWVYDVLKEEGYVYSSSVYPVKHDHYGIPDAPRFRYTAGADIIEYPLSTLKLGSRNLPISGGGYFRLYPYAFTRMAIERFNRVEKQPYIFYLHPWEIDPDQPRIPNISAKTRFRHYLNLNRVEKRLKAMLKDFSWTRMDRLHHDV